MSAATSTTGQESDPIEQKILAPIEGLETIQGYIDVLKEGQTRQKGGRINFEPGNIEQSMAKLVLTVVELLYQLMERQALRRVDGGSLTEDEIENLGLAFMQIDRCINEMADLFELNRSDLNLDLGPLGNLL